MQTRTYRIESQPMYIVPEPQLLFPTDGKTKRRRRRAEERKKHIQEMITLRNNSK